MKPIELKIKGINSFKEEQIIDFNELTKSGLFGIFGNTGSGKSSILDSISLALYGETARKSTGFVNTSSKNAIVHFKFEVNDIKYAVEKTFTKTKTNSIQTKNAKVYELSDIYEPITIAEGSTDVKNKCIEIIGLNKDDFFRTVIIPQGQFSNFLNLKGLERRQMLERLFNLEEYGDKLNDKIKAKKLVFNNELIHLDSVISTLGDISKHSCDLLKSELDAISKNLIGLNQKQIDILKNYEIIKTNWQLQEEKIEYTQKLEILKLKQPEIENKINQIELSNKANLVKPCYDAKNIIFCDLNNANKSYETIKEELQNLNDKKEIILESHKISQENKDVKIPKLSILKSKLDVALKDEEKSIELKNIIENIDIQLKNVIDNKDIIETLNIKSSNEQQNLIEEISVLEKKSIENIVTSEYREKVDNGIELFKEVKIIKDEKEKTLDNIEKSILQIKTLKSEIDNLQSKEIDYNTKLGSLNISISTNNDSQILQQLKEKLENTKQESHKYEIDNIVSTLQSECTLGNPCPVCGIHLEKIPEFKINTKINYKKIIKDLQIEILSLEEKIKTQSEDNQKQISELKISNATINTEINSKKDLILKEENTLNSLNNEYENINQKLKSIENNAQIKDFQDELKDIKNKDKQKEKIEKDLSISRNSLNEINSLLKDNENKINEYNLSIATINTDKNNKNELLIDLTQKLKTVFGQEYNITHQLNETIEEINIINENFEKSQNEKNNLDIELTQKEKEYNTQQGIVTTLQSKYNESIDNLNLEMQKNSFDTEENFLNALIDEDTLNDFQSQITTFNRLLSEATGTLSSINLKIGDTEVSKEDFNSINSQKLDIEQNIKTQTSLQGSKQSEYNSSIQKLEQHQNTLKQKTELEHQIALITELSKLFEASKFVEYVANSRLKQICFSASKQLLTITNGAYELDIDSNNQFIIIHNAQGGARRPTNTLSGGETFMTSLALALALSTQIQLKATAPIELFFLDEGFGSLDDNLLDIVMDSIENIHNDRLKIGIISHVERIKSRVPIKLLVEPANSNIGSSITISHT